MTTHRADRPALAHQDASVRNASAARVHLPADGHMDDEIAVLPAVSGIMTGRMTPRAIEARVRFPRIDWHELWADDTDEEWILEPLLPARRQVVIYSAPKVGKSLLILEVAVGIARGIETLGVKPPRAYRVLYLDFENDPRGDIRSRLQSMGYGPDDLDNLCVLSFPALAGLDSERGSAELLQAVQEYRCEVVIIDTVSRSVRGEENENDTWLNFYRHTGLKLKQAQVALIRLDHTGKDESKGQRGGSAKSGDVDAVWRLSKVTDGTYRLDCEAHRLPIAEKTILLKRESMPLRHQVQAEGRIAAFNTKVNEIVQVLDRAGAPNSTGQIKARKILKANGSTAGNDALTEAIRVRRG
jgi:RecA-family ATPase